MKRQVDTDQQPDSVCFKLSQLLQGFAPPQYFHLLFSFVVLISVQMDLLAFETTGVGHFHRA